MSFISTEELRKIAKASQLALHNDQIESLRKQVDGVLAYAQLVNTCTFTNEQTVNELIQTNVTRPDNAVRTPCEPLLAQAPAREGNFFVVPMILDHGQ